MLGIVFFGAGIVAFIISSIVAVTTFCNYCSSRPKNRGPIWAFLLFALGGVIAVPVLAIAIISVKAPENANQDQSYEQALKVMIALGCSPLGAMLGNIGLAIRR